MPRRARATIRKLLKTRVSLWLVLALLLLVAGLYLLLVILGPSLPIGPTPETVAKKVQQTKQIQEDRLYIPKIGVNVPIGGTETALLKGAWHRKPASGNPEKGGNFVLSGHRFQMGFTPQDSHARSPFYHIDRLKPGDKLYVDYGKKRYTYAVTKKYEVSRYAVTIENPSREAKLTLYSCNLRGEAAGREVIEAKPSS